MSKAKELVPEHFVRADVFEVDVMEMRSAHHIFMLRISAKSDRKMADSFFDFEQALNLAYEAIVLRPSINVISKRIIVKIADTFYRAKYLNFECKSSQNSHVNVFLYDYGTHHTVASKNIYKALPELFEFPFQAVEFRLTDLKALYGMRDNILRSDFVEGFIKDAERVQIKIKGFNQNVIFGYMFVKIGPNTYCLNEEIIKMGYSMKINTNCPLKIIDLVLTYKAKSFEKTSSQNLAAKTMAAKNEMERMMHEACVENDEEFKKLGIPNDIEEYTNYIRKYARRNMNYNVSAGKVQNAPNATGTSKVVVRLGLGRGAGESFPHFNFEPNQPGMEKTVPKFEQMHSTVPTETCDILGGKVAEVVNITDSTAPTRNKRGLGRKCLLQSNILEKSQRKVQSTVPTKCDINKKEEVWKKLGLEHSSPVTMSLLPNFLGTPNSNQYNVPAKQCEVVGKVKEIKTITLGRGRDLLTLFQPKTPEIPQITHPATSEVSDGKEKVVCCNISDTSETTSSSLVGLGDIAAKSEVSNDKGKAVYCNISAATSEITSSLS